MNSGGIKSGGMNSDRGGMNSDRAKTAGRVFRLGGSIVLLVTWVACSQPAVETPTDDGEAPVDVTLSCSDGSSAIELDCPALPNTTASGTMLTVDDQTVLDYDLWAWNSFIALNWPAADPADAPNLRGLPDTGYTFASAANDATTVWETFKEKREIFLYDYQNNSPSSETPLGWNEGPTYGPTSSQVPCCPGQDCSTGGDVFERHLANASGVFSDTLDETVEVASQPRETSSALCAGYSSTTTPTLAECQGLFPQTTSESELAQRDPVGPRVYFQGPDDSQPSPVLYEVKLNKDYFDYVITNNFYDITTTRNYITNTGPITLPARTSHSAMPPQVGTQTTAGPNTGKTSYSSSTCLSDYQNNALCEIGSIQVKAGWVDLSEASTATRATYHTADVLHYRSNSEVTGGICKEPATYGLAGLHIIQRIHQDDRQGGEGGTGSDNNQGPPRGGTFIFATWEHMGNDSATTSYANFIAAKGGFDPPPPGPYPAIDTTNNSGGIPLDRLYDVLPTTAAATTLAHSAISTANPNSVWLNYRLIGTQYVAATPTSSELPTQVRELPTTPQTGFEYPAGSGQPYYLANLVVESNIGLQQFQGLPPTGQGPIDQQVVQVIPHYRASNTSTPGNVTSQFASGAYQRTAENLAFRTQSAGHPHTLAYNMGGCMGCHGVAQLSGYSFSFVLLDNQYGGAPDTVDDFSVPPVVQSP